MGTCKSPFPGFGNQDGNYLKFYQGNLVAVEGAAFGEKLILENIRIPYKQILKSRVILQKGQSNYLLNHLGLGDNATFLGIAVTYDPASKIETDNYLTYTYFSDPTKIYPIGKVLMLSGNSTHRIEQIYITNPNENYAVQLDVLVAIIDDQYNYFAETGITINTNITFSDLEYSDLITWTPCDRIAILNSQGEPQMFIPICDIAAIQRCDKILVIDDKNYATIYLDFISEQHAIYALSLLSYQIENPCSYMQAILFGDNTAPIIEFNDLVVPITAQIPNNWNGTDRFDTTEATDFEATISLLNDDTNANFTNTELKDLLIFNVYDAVDGDLNFAFVNMTVKNASGTTVANLTTAGEYTVTFELVDLVGNSIPQNVLLTLTVTP